jgi:hypothetical protein
MKQELIIFIGIFLVLAIGMHFKEWLGYPIEHLIALPSASAYGLGAEHPFVFTLIVYIIVAIPRGIGKLFSKKNNQEEI